MIVSASFTLRSAALRFKELAEAIELIEEEPTVIAMEDAWQRVEEVEKLISEAGINPLMIDIFDARVEPSLASSLDADTIAIARERRLLYSAVAETPVRFSLEQRMSRRELLLRGYKRIAQWLNVPLVDIDLCNVLDGCDLCVKSCPYGALSGKPPSLDYDKCTSCGLCVGLCPIEALFFPALLAEGIEWYMRTIREKSPEPFYLIITTYGLLSSLSELSGVMPSLVLPLRRLEELPPLSAARFFSRGFKPVIYGKMSAEIAKLYSELESLGAVEIAEGENELRRILSKELSIKDIGENSTYRGFFRLSLGEVVERAKLSFPGYADLEVDEKACTLCSACERACPTGALRIIDESRLILLRDDCIGCGKCAKICPEGAIKSIEWILSRPEQRELARSEMAHCVKCGKPIGPESLISWVERRLAATGAPARNVRLCQECKALSLLED